jgi:hypothetical protein
MVTSHPCSRGLGSVSWAKVTEWRDGSYAVQAQAPGIYIKSPVIFYSRHEAFDLAERIVGDEVEFELIPEHWCRNAWYGEAA